MLGVSKYLVTTLSAALVFIAPVLAAVGDSTSRASLEGIWTALLQDSLCLIVNIHKTSNGVWDGNLNSVDQGGQLLPIENVSVQDNGRVHFELKRVGGIYEGRANRDYTQLDGTFTQPGMPPEFLSFARAGTCKVKGNIATETASGTPCIYVKVPFGPVSFTALGRTYVVYELQVGNLSERECTLSELDVFSPEKTISKFAGRRLEEMVSTPVGSNEQQKLKIGPGKSLVAYVWIPLGSLRNETPLSIKHLLRLRTDDRNEAVCVTTAPIGIVSKVDKISSMFQEGDWLAVNGPSNKSPHRRALQLGKGGSHIAQRFAVDFVRLYPDGKVYHGDPKSNNSYFGYGSRVCSATDGIVSSVNDQIPDNIPGANSRAVRMTADTVGGNYVGVDLRNGHFAFYAHLQPGSINVKPGDIVHRGQVLGLVGNSGESTEPHLHFQLCDANSLQNSEGVPFTCTYESLGLYDGKTFKSLEAKVSGIPLQNEILRFTPENSKNDLTRTKTAQRL